MKFLYTSLQEIKSFTVPGTAYTDIDQKKSSQLKSWFKLFSEPPSFHSACRQHVCEFFYLAPGLLHSHGLCLWASHLPTC